VRAVDLLHDPIHIKFFSDANKLKSEEILFIFKIFFQFLNKSDILKLKNSISQLSDETLWFECCNYFTNQIKSNDKNTIGITKKYNLLIRNDRNFCCKQI